MPSQPGPDGLHTFAPLRAFEVARYAETLVALLIDYSATDEDHDADRTTRLQLHMPPQTALHLARLLTVQAMTILGTPKGNPN